MAPYKKWFHESAEDQYGSIAQVGGPQGLVPMWGAGLVPNPTPKTLSGAEGVGFWVLLQGLVPR
jgi:hypothetical protein